MTDPIPRLNAALEGRYRVERELGAGGMATVYLADDLRHERKVALKVLRPELAAVMGADRFLSEIRTTANLQHPNILPLFDSGEADGFLFYVMPYVEGESLRDKLDREKQLPIDAALRIATEVAEALDHAHRAGVVHRDIKPANVLLRDGRPLVADFGIALAVSAAGGGRLTETGLSLGTPFYMSPEQATADRDPDARSDVYSLGCVLYEMLAGDPPHVASTAQAMLAKILTDDVRPVTELRATVPAHVAAAVATSLSRLPADRWESAGEFARALRDRSLTADRLNPVLRAGSAETGRWSPARVLFTGAAALVGVVAGLAIGSGLGSDAAGESGTFRFTFPVPGGFGSWDWESPLMTITPDGSAVVYVSEGSLHVRRLDTFESYVLEGTEGADDPFVSPDSRFVGFARDRRLYRIPIEGGAVELLSDVAVLYSPGAAWGESGELVYSSGSAGEGLFTVAVDGSQPQGLTQLDTTAAEYYHQWPQFLDDDRKVLFTVVGLSGLWEDARIDVIDRDTGVRTTVRERATFGRYLDSGHVLYVDADGTLYALPFDLESLQATGSPFAIESGIQVARWGGVGSLAVSENGVMAFARGSHDEKHLLQWVDRSGSPFGNLGPATLAGAMRLSPDETRVLTWLSRPANADLYLVDAVTGAPERLTYEPSWEWSAAWAPDGERIAYSSSRAGYNIILTQSTQGEGSAELAYQGEQELWPTSWSGDGEWIAFEESPFGNRMDMLAVKVGAPDSTVTIAATENWECCGRFSPNGRWMAYQADEDGGAPQIHVVAFPELTPRRQVSSVTGVEPRWSPGGDELYFWEGPTLMSVPIADPDRLPTAAARSVFTLSDRQMAGDPAYAPTADGSRFLLKLLNEASIPREIHVVTNLGDVIRGMEAGQGAG